MRDLGAQNDCLLLKMLHRLHAAPPSRWVAWVWAELDDCSLLTTSASSLDGVHWLALRSLLPAYRALSRVAVGDGWKTSFWHDRWLPCGPLGAVFPAMFSHSTCLEVTVWQVRRCEVDVVLVPRLSRITGGERERCSVFCAAVRPRRKRTSGASLFALPPWRLLQVYVRPVLPGRCVRSHRQFPVRFTDGLLGEVLRLAPLIGQGPHPRCPPSENYHQCAESGVPLLLGYA